MGLRRSRLAHFRIVHQRRAERSKCLVPLSNRRPGSSFLQTVIEPSHSGAAPASWGSRRLPALPLCAAALRYFSSWRPGDRRRPDVGLGNVCLSGPGSSGHNQDALAAGDCLARGDRLTRGTINGCVLPHELPRGAIFNWISGKAISRHDSEGFVRCRPVNSKIPVVDGKHGFDVLPAGQMNERGVGELGLEAPILSQDRCNLHSICLIQFQNSVQTEGRRLQQFFDGARIVPQKPGSFCQHWPAGIQGRSEVLQRPSASFVELILRGQNRDQRPSVNENPIHCFSPNPSKCFGLVLRSRGPGFAHPITPA
jgi:hypothetical protein